MAALQQLERSAPKARVALRREELALDAQVHYLGPTRLDQARPPTRRSGWRCGAENPSARRSW
jgi:hypothetical protein